MKLFMPVDLFLEKAAVDNHLLPTYISLFMALFYYSNPADPLLKFQVCRRKLMHFSRIRSTSTYHKRISELVTYGYITYEPSYDPFQGSRVSIICKKV
jgi:hypothetical protein